MQVLRKQKKKKTKSEKNKKKKKKTCNWKNFDIHNQYIHFYVK